MRHSVGVRKLINFWGAWDLKNVMALPVVYVKLGAAGMATAIASNVDDLLTASSGMEGI